MWTMSDAMPARASTSCVSISELIPKPLMMRAFSGIISCTAATFAGDHAFHGPAGNCHDQYLPNGAL